MAIALLKQTEKGQHKNVKSTPLIHQHAEAKDHTVYLFEQKIIDGVNVHDGVEFFETNMPIGMLPPSLADSADVAKYREEYGNAVADFLDGYATQNRDKTYAKPNPLIAFKWVLSFKQDELAHLETDEEKATFMKERAKDYLVAMGCTNSNEFFYALAPHLKDENPHVHIIQSAYKRDGNLHNFFIGKRFDGGITDVFADVSYKHEQQYPFLARNEHKTRDKHLQISLDTVGKAAGPDAGIYNLIADLSSSYSAESYSHAQVKAALEAAGYSMQSHRKNGKMHDIYLINNASEKLDQRSYKAMPLTMKKFLEMHEFHSYVKNKHKVDISSVTAKAIALTRSMQNGQIEELNQKLRDEFNVMLVPSKGAGKFHSWNLYYGDIDERIPLPKLGFETKLHINKLTQQPIQLLDISDEQFKALVNEQSTISASLKEFKQRARASRSKPHRPYTRFAYLDDETTEEFIARMRVESVMNALTRHQYLNNTLYSDFNKREMWKRKSENEYEMLQSNKSSADSLIAQIVASGNDQIEFVGTACPEIQAQLYLAAMRAGVEVKNYTPSSALVDQAQQEADATYRKTVTANLKKIDARISADLAEPDRQQHRVFLHANSRLRRDVDQIPRLYGALYGLHRGLDISAFAYIDSVKQMPPEDVQKVVRDAQQDLQLTNEQIRTYLIALEIETSEDPVNEHEKRIEQKQAPVQPDQQPKAKPQPSTPIEPNVPAQKKQRSNRMKPQ
ncbi:TPA: hypothetical protein NID02_001605 [Pseudomonas aeruginosa]|nr:hypothetical protein [Pseudomonas aeruginosa]